MKESILERNERIGADAKRAAFMVKQQQSYEFKVRYAALRAHEFVRMCDEHDKNYHVSVGGLDSITLFVFLHSIGIRCPGISASYLECKGNQRVHKALGIESIKPMKRSDGKAWSKSAVIQEFGFPVLSKEIASKIELLQNPSPKNATVRHAIITGETGEYGGNRKGTRMKLAQKWLEKFGGYENETEGVNYGKPDFKVSSKCCYYLKEKPCDIWAKEHNSVPFLGLMASEGGRREKSLMVNGCNYWTKGTQRSAPFAIFNRTDILRLTLEMDKYYHEHWREFGDYEIESIIPPEYGEIEADGNGNLHTTGAQRTGCSMCGFGIHLEKRPHRFDRLYTENRKEWTYLMYFCYTDAQGKSRGWSDVLDYIGVGWSPETNPLCEPEQITMLEGEGI
ncbi:MAG: hypothetical protein IKJ04_06405 [Clostridia bacterium]|nr:hypothetical protein [Clostridia bacterium]